jgi:anaerobic ribonucleoside-triphosphate reductase
MKLISYCLNKKKKRKEAALYDISDIQKIIKKNNRINLNYFYKNSLYEKHLFQTYQYLKNRKK